MTEQTWPPADREQRAEQTFTRLFGPRDTTAPDKDPEFGQILRKLIFSDVFATGELDDRTRELITCTVLACVQALPQLKAHAAAALNVGVEPVALREAIYQLAPLMGFPRTLNAIAVLDEVFESRGVELPLPEQASVTDADRMARGAALQQEVYGTEIAEALAGLPAPYATAVPGMLTGWLFGDHMSRDGLDRATRELLILMGLTALNLSGPIPAHVRGCLEAGNQVETVLAAVVQAMPYCGFPAGLVTARAVLAHLEQA
ncbi:carboxymuconolactone decarboxylase family protein [Luteococcus peritonei]|uniref:Carboxymuconolactone decarboxylase family protein n=1 Tax=Luteococcus peritonei TaxID=88874 RepID=A0ABW4RU22_9ACTN